MKGVLELAGDVVDDLCSRNPILCTALGVPGSDHEWGETFGLAGVSEELEIRAGYRTALEPFLDSDDPDQRFAARIIVGDFDEWRSGYEAMDHFRDLRHLGSPFHQIRNIFELMRTDTGEARDNIVRRLDTISKPLSDYQERLEAGLAAGIVVSKRQVESVMSQARTISRDPKSINEVVRKVEGEDGPSQALTTAAEGARAAYDRFADWLETRYLPHAPEVDGVGRDVYARAADRLVGTAVDPDEAYRWGWEELGRLAAEMERVADQVLPGEGVAATKAFLETDPSVTASGTSELLSFVEEVLAQAVADLAGSHFDVPDVIRPLTVQLAPPGSPLGVYYQRPSEDFSRPGGVRYSLGGQEVFPLYQHVSTAYHEGFPGHHLQIATALYRRDTISRYQRLMIWCPGYGEGWGMYAEVLMGELGYLENPQHYFGMLAKQMYRAARIVVDIGLHLDKPIDEGSPKFAGERWTFDKAVEFMSVYGFRTPAQARDEVLRYLGWAGQAIAYKLGEREILRIREDARRRSGAAFDLAAFHSTVLNHGTMRLDLLDQVVSERLAG